MTQAMIDDRLWRVDKSQPTGQLELGPDAWPDPDLSELVLVESLPDAVALAPELPRARGKIEGLSARQATPASSTMQSVTPEQRSAAGLASPPATSGDQAFEASAVQGLLEELPDSNDLPGLDDLGLPPLPDVLEGPASSGPSAMPSGIAAVPSVSPSTLPASSASPASQGLPTPSMEEDGNLFALEAPPPLDGLSLEALSFNAPSAAQAMPEKEPTAGVDGSGVPGAGASMDTLLMPLDDTVPGLDELIFAAPNLSLEGTGVATAVDGPASYLSSPGSGDTGDEVLALTGDASPEGSALDAMANSDAGLVGWSDPVIPPAETSEDPPAPAPRPVEVSDSGLLFEGGTPIEFAPPAPPALDSLVVAELEEAGTATAAGTAPPGPAAAEVSVPAPGASAPGTGTHPPAAALVDATAFKHASGTYPPAPMQLDAAAFKHASGSYPPVAAPEPAAPAPVGAPTPPPAPAAAPGAGGAATEREKITLTPTGSYVVMRAKKTVALHAMGDAAAAAGDPGEEDAEAVAAPAGDPDGDGISKTGLQKMARQAVVRSKQAAARRRVKVRVTDLTGMSARARNRRWVSGVAGVGLAALAAFVLLDKDMLARWLNDVMPVASVAPASVTNAQPPKGTEEAGVNGTDGTSQQGLSKKVAAELSGPGGQAAGQAAAGQAAPAGAVTSAGTGTGAPTELAAIPSPAVVDASTDAMLVDAALGKGDDASIVLDPSDPNFETRLKLRELVTRGKDAVKNSDYSIAVDSFEAAREVARDLQDQRALTWLRGQLGRTYLIRGELVMRDSYVTWEDCRLAREDFIKAAALGFDGERCQADMRNAEICTNRHTPTKRTARR